MDSTKDSHSTSGYHSDEDAEKKQQDSSSNAVELKQEQTQEPPAAPVTTNDERKYLTGLKLLAVMTAVSLPWFLMLLDISIVSTVSVKVPSLSFIADRSI